MYIKANLYKYVSLSIYYQMEKIKKIKGYDVSFVKMELGERFPSWVCAYVNLIGNLKEDYSFETYREKNVVGIDTNHGYNQKQSIEEKYEDAEKQITSIIEEHLKYN